METIFLIALSLSAIGIAWQDIRTRLVSVWLIVLFFSTNVGAYVSEQGTPRLANNAVFCLIYMLLNGLFIALYFLVKRDKRFMQPGEFLGLGDVLVIFAIGVCLEPMVIVLFFTAAFVVTMLIHLLASSGKSVPLAGWLSLLYAFAKLTGGVGYFQ